MRAFCQKGFEVADLDPYLHGEGIIRKKAKFMNNFQC